MSLEKKVLRLEGFVLVLTLLLVVQAAAQVGGTANYNAYFSYYGTQTGVPTSQYYFPVIDSKACEEGAGQDFVIEIAPGDCSPAVVRSDLLEEQNVPVFCKLTGVKVNPLIEVPYIKSVNIIGTPPEGIRTVLFHPYRAAVRRTTLYNPLEGSPINNNLGYVVVVLNKIPVEKDMPDMVHANLTAKIEYDVSTSFGITNDDLVLSDMGDKDWMRSYEQNTFWDGKGYVRATNIKDNSATIGIYASPERVIRTFNLQAGAGRSSIIYMPGMYCSSGLQVELKQVVVPKAKATLDIDGKRTDVIEGTKILDGKCNVRKIESTPYSLGGEVEISCPDKSYTLKREGAKVNLKINDVDTNPDGYTPGDLVNLGNKKYLLTTFVGNYVIFRENDEVIEKRIVVLQDSKKNRTLKDVNQKISAILSRGFFKDDAGFNSLISEIQRNFPDVEMIVDDVNNPLNKKIGEVTVEIASVKGIIQSNYPDIVEKYYRGYKGSYEKIVEDLPNEKEGPKDKFYGEVALWQAAETAKKMGKDYDRLKIYEEIIKKYPKSNYVSESKKQLEILYSSGSSEESSGIISSRGEAFFVSLEGVTEPKAEESNVDLFVNGIKRSGLGIGSFVDVGRDWYIKEINDNSVKFERIAEKKEARIDRTINLGALEALDELQVKVQDIHLEKYAVVSVYPFDRQGKTFANFSVHIGIEKRAIKLSVDQTKDLINKLDKTITDFEEITEKLGKVVEDWKKVCLAGSAALWVESFFEGLISEGQSIARRYVMRENIMEDGSKGFMEWCTKPENRDALGERLDTTVNDFNECIYRSGEDIEKALETKQNSIKAWEEINKELKTEESGILKKTCTFKIFCKARVDEPELIKQYKEKVFDSYGLSGSIGKYNSVEAKEIIAKFPDLFDDNLVGLEDARNLDSNVRVLLDCKGQKDDLDPNSPFCKGVENTLFQRLERYNNLLTDLKDSKEAANDLKRYGIESAPLVTDSQKPLDAPVYKFRDLNDSLKKQLSTLSSKLKDGTEIVFFKASLNREVIGAGTTERLAANGAYAAVVTRITNERYGVDNKTYFKIERDGSVRHIDDIESKALFSRASAFIPREKCSYVYEDPKVQFWGSGPFRGLPAIMPLGKGTDGSTGWYAATKPYGDSLRSGLTKVQAYTEAGEPTHFYIANVGENNQPDFGSSPGGDDSKCSQYFALSETYQGQTRLGGMTEAQTKRFVEQSVRCLKQASDKAKTTKGGKIKTSCGTFEVGEAKAITPGLECEDFMSPFKCSLLYNMCDPVICPPSRCNLGGRFQTDNVVQTGIIGSLALCAPNFGSPLTDGGVMVPVCLTGVHAGLDSLTSMFKQVRGCLQESLDTGRHIGICDQLQSVFLCDFFWKEITPFLKVGIPQLIERTVYGRRGGGEYLTFAESYENSLKQVQFFTTYYGENTLRAFQVRSTAEAGSLVCKAFVGLRYPDSASIFDELAKPESPTQFNGWFDEMPFSSVTVPPTSQYKVFWYIFAGRDEPGYWQVYLKEPPFSPGIILPDRYVVQTGYVGTGESISESRDFTAPSGYKQLCIRVNLKEECGFKKVSTGFGVEELTNYYVASQTVPGEEKITSEQECTSGTSALLTADSIPGALLATTPFLTQPTIGGLQETIGPSIQRRGIVRICSGENPGKGSNSDNWDQVGYCDESRRIGCWLDRGTVAGAINDLGLLNATLADSLNASRRLLEATEDYHSPAESSETLAKLKKDGAVEAVKEMIGDLVVVNLRNKDVAKRVDEQLADILSTSTVNSLKNLVEFSIDKTDRARAQLKLAEIYETIVLKLRGAPSAPETGPGGGDSTPNKGAERERLEREKAKGDSKICKLQSVAWQTPGAKVKDGDKVEVVATANGDCEGVEAVISVKEDDFSGDRLIPDYNKIKITFDKKELNIVKGEWIAKWEPDIIPTGLANRVAEEAEFYPIIELYDQKISGDSSNSKLISVAQPPHYRYEIVRAEIDRKDLAKEFGITETQIVKWNERLLKTSQKEGGGVHKFYKGAKIHLYLNQGVYASLSDDLRSKLKR
ncbi:tol-pal system YbgF family protein [Nanoarchaeota archaeon]